jgi:hypothetical protein
MHDTKERLSLLWIFALLNYLYADVVALFAIVGSPNLADAPHLPPWALLGSAVLMEIPIAMILACRLLPYQREPAGERHRGCNVDPCKRRPDLRSAFFRCPDARSC